jgi:hypothetical protein
MNDQFWLPYALECMRGHFKRYVIYDAGSKDLTGNIIDWFVETEKQNASFYVRKLPHLTPDIQGIFRNSMIAEAQSEWIWLADGDEVYSKDSMQNLCSHRLDTGEWYPYGRKIYGMVKRIEMDESLLTKYSDQRSHHRLYHRTAIWKGTHPGEEAVHPQNDKTQEWLPGVTCYHFHNAIRSPLEGEVPSRIKRKSQRTYHPGNLVEFNLLKELPILRKPINNFAVNPQLEELQAKYGNL